MNSTVQCFFYSFLCAYACTLFGQLQNLDYVALQTELAIYDFAELKSSYVTFAKDTVDNKFIIKQCKQTEHFYRPAKSVLEMVALEMGHATNIPLNHACLIPVGVPFIGKDTSSPATLHIHLPGIPFDIWEKINHVPWRKYRNLKIKQKEPLGISREVIHYMSQHKDLSRLVAFDTFVGNADRGIGNLFFDETADKFYGIDMGGSFFRDLCKPTAKKIQNYMSNKKITFTRKEWKGLREYYKTLVKLISRYPPEKIGTLIDYYAQEAGLVAQTELLDERVIKNYLNYFKTCKSVIEKSYRHAVKLAEYLEKLLKKNKFLPKTAYFF